MKPIVYDAGVLIAADRNERSVWAEHRVRLEAGLVPMVPAAVVAQASRAPAQVQMRRLLQGCDVVPMDESAAHAVGLLLAKTGTKDIADASVAVVAARHAADVLTADVEDMHALLSAARAKARIYRL